MGKTRRGHKELSKEQYLKHENNQLRREVNRLRKQLARIDLDRYGHIKDIVQEHYAKEDAEESTQEMLNRMKEQWRCHECSLGFLEIFLYTKAGEPWYFRRCNGPSCGHRTKSQKYDSNKVQGLMPEPEKDR